MKPYALQTVHLYIYIYTYIHSYTYTHIHIYTYIHIHIHIHIDPDTDECRIFPHCSSAILWVERIIHRRPDAAARHPHDERDEDAEEEDGGGHSHSGRRNAVTAARSGAVRSRSPRRDATTTSEAPPGACIDCAGETGPVNPAAHSSRIPTPCRNTRVLPLLAPFNENPTLDAEHGDGDRCDDRSGASEADHTRLMCVEHGSRSPAAGTPVSDADLSCGLVTLLEQAIPDNEPVFSKAVDVLLRAGCPRGCADGEQNVPSSTPLHARRAALRLADCVEPPCFDLTATSAPIGKTLQDAQALFRSFWVDLRDTLPDGLQIHPATAQALGGVTRNCGDRPDRHEIFCDGSFDGACSAWSVVVLDILGNCVTAVRWTAGKVCLDPSSAEWLGAVQHGSLQAETSGVCFAMIWAMHGVAYQRPTCQVDSLCALQRASGSWRFQLTDDLASACRSLMQTAEMLGCVSFDAIQHVRGHSQHPWNELADALAKYAIAQDVGTCQVAGLAAWILDRSVEHLWLIVAAAREPHLWPHHRYDAFVNVGGVHLGQQEHPARYFGESFPLVQAPKASAQWRSMKVVTLNVQTLESKAPSEAGDFAGRVAYLRAQFADIGAAIVGLQETRSPQSSAVLSDSFLRLSSGCSDSGQLGVEIWFARSSKSSAPTFSLDDLIVVHRDSRTLCVKVRSAHLQALVVNVHAPTAQSAEREAWWGNLRRILASTCSGQQVLLLGDFNVRFAQTVPNRVGDLVWDSRYSTPEALPLLLEEHDLWVPATFTGVHVGQHETWLAPGSQSAARLDYVAPPASWYAGPGSSQVLLDIDPAHKSVDHFAVSLDVWFPVKERPSRRPAPLRLDTKSMATDQGQAKVRNICAGIPLQDWRLDVDTHFLRMQDYLCQALSSAFPAPKPRCSKTFFSAETWVVKDQRVWLRRQTAHQRYRSRYLELLTAFRAWGKGCAFVDAACRMAFLVCGETLRAGQAVDQLRRTRNTLRKSIRNDRRKWLHELVQDSECIGVKDVVARLRPLLRVSGRRQHYQRALPMVQLEDGALATSQEEARDRWIRHFASIEGGERVSLQDMVQCRRRCLAEPCEQVVIQLGELPTRIALERSCQDAMSGKACGPDGIPGEALKFGAGQISKALMQLMLKLSLRGSEPLAFKGGKLVNAWKHKGLQSVCSNHRALLISSVVGKSLHSVVRRQAVQDPRPLGGSKK